MVMIDWPETWTKSLDRVRKLRQITYRHYRILYVSVCVSLQFVMRHVARVHMDVSETLICHSAPLADDQPSVKIHRFRLSQGHWQGAIRKLDLEY